MSVCKKPVLPFLIAFIAFLVTASPSSLLAQPATQQLTIVDNSGKEHKISAWKFTTGTRRLNWLASEEEKKVAKKPAEVGPEVLEFTEGKLPPLKQRVLTLVPLKHIRSLEYDVKKNTVTLKVAKTADTDVVLQGPTGFVGVNILSIEAEENLGEFGKAEIKFLGGVSRGVKSIVFAAPVPLEPMPQGRPALVETSDKNNKSFTTIDLKPLYQQSTQALYLEPSLSFQKSVRIDVDKIHQLSHVGSGSGLKGGLVYDVKLKGGTQKPLVLIETRPLSKNVSEFLQGLIGRVEVGYKLVPMITIQQVTFDQTTEAAPPMKKQSVPQSR